MDIPHRILIVDDEPNLRRILQAAFEKSGVQAATAEDGEQALRKLESETFACVLTDVTMPGISGYELQRHIRSQWPDLPVVIMTAFGTIPQAVQSIRDGAYEFVTKPFDLDVIRKVVLSAIDQPLTANRQPPTAKKALKHDRSFIAESSAMKEVLAMIDQVADARATVLITGESGTGKEVVARMLHERSSRSRHSFVPVSCAALPESLLESELFGYEKGAFTGATHSKPGRFESADHGTLFLDEIGEVPLSIQVKLLRVLQERELERLGSTKATKVDVRLVAATNRDLQLAVDEGGFRLDLLYRLKVVDLELPALRNREEDILPLAHHFLIRYATENMREIKDIPSDTQRALLTYAWPGNVRELENTIERAVVLAGKHETDLTPKMLPSSIRLAA